MATIDGILGRVWLGNSLRDYLAAFVCVLLSVLVARLVRRRLSGLLKRLAAVTETTLDDRLAAELVGPLAGLIVLVGLHFVVLVLDMPSGTRHTLTTALTVAFAFVLTSASLRVVDAVFSEVLVPWAHRTKGKLDDHLVRFGRKLSKILVVVVASVVVLESVGLNVLSLVTGLGIGGLAVALAAQETLGNVLGSLQIMTDQPFGIGDWIRVSGHFGKVDDIGLRSTKVMTRGRIMVVIPNKDIAGSAIENLSIGDDLVVDLRLGLTYDTPADRIEEALAVVRQILDDDPGIVPTKMLHFLDFADSSLVLQCTYFVSDIDRYWDIQHNVNLAIKRRFDDAGLEFAFPTHTVHLVKDPA